MAFAVAFMGYYVSWFLTYPMLLGLAYDCDKSGRLAVMTTGTWLLAQSFGSLAAGAIAQGFGGYAPIGPLGALTCIAAVAVVWPLARRFDAIKAPSAPSKEDYGGRAHRSARSSRR